MELIHSGDERLDIYDEQRNPMGTALRRTAHEQGLWHRTFQCWIFKCSKGEYFILFQLRHPGKETFPGLLDITCAGHLTAGESVAAGGLRELQEELGLEISVDELSACGVFKEQDFIEKNGWIDREHCHLYVYECDRSLKQYRLQPDEVQGLFWIRLADFKALLNGSRQVLQAVGVKVNEEGILKPEKRSCAAKHFVPHSRNYYERVVRRIEKYGMIGEENVTQKEDEQ